MTPPSNQSGIPSLPVVGLLAVILFLGLVLAPRAFEFRAWPEFARPDAVEAVVDRPLPEVPRIEVAGVRASEARRGGTRNAVASGRSRARSPERATERRARRTGATRGGSSRRDGRRYEPRRNSGELPAEDSPEVVVEVPGPAAPSAPAPEQPAQLAEVPPADTVLRPEAPKEPQLPAREFDLSGRGVDDLDVKGYAGGDEGRGRGKGRGEGCGHSGHGSGHAKGRGRGKGRGRRG
jgi:hypothetical protein